MCEISAELRREMIQDHLVLKALRLNCQQSEKEKSPAVCVTNPDIPSAHAQQNEGILHCPMLSYFHFQLLVLQGRLVLVYSTK